MNGPYNFGFLGPLALVLIYLNTYTNDEGNKIKQKGEKNAERERNLRRIITLGCCALGIVLLASSDGLAQKGFKKGKGGKSARILSETGKTVRETAHRTPTRTNVRVTREVTPRSGAEGSTTRPQGQVTVKTSLNKKGEIVGAKVEAKLAQHTAAMPSVRLATQMELARPQRTLGIARFPDRIHTNDVIANLLKNRDYYGPRIKAAKVSESTAELITEKTTVSTLLENGVEEVKAREAKPGDWLVRRIDPKTGQPKEGYVVYAADFPRLYKPVEGKEGVYQSAGEMREFVYVRKYSPTDLVVDYWDGYVQHAEGGFYLNITEIGEGKPNVDTYLVAPDEFMASHKVFAKFPDQINTNVLIKQLLEDPQYYGPVIKAVKVAESTAELITEKMTVSTLLENGVEEVKAREAKPGDWLVKRIDPKTGQPKEGYVVYAADFPRLYKPVEGKAGVYESAEGVREFVFIDKNSPTDLVVDYWSGHVQHFEDGFYLNITEIGEGKPNVDTYGVATQEFNTGHRIVE